MLRDLRIPQNHQPAQIKNACSAQVDGLTRLGTVIAVVGGIVAANGILSGFTASPGSAPQQTVAALWMIEGLLGLLITAIGLLIVTISKLAGPVLQTISRVVLPKASSELLQTQDMTLRSEPTALQPIGS